jgi:hypothetical protein
MIYQTTITTRILTATKYILQLMQTPYPLEQALDVETEHTVLVKVVEEPVLIMAA